jgi:uncharacterized protein
MPSAELVRLHKLYLIDQALLEIRKRAATLDPGRKTASEIAALQKELDGSPARILHAEMTDLELKQKSYQEKIAKFEKELYSGKVVNPREVEAIQKEISILKRQRGELDDRIMQIWEELPGEQAKSAKFEKALDERKAKLAGEQRAALQAKTQLEAEFKQKSAERPAAAKEVPPTLLARYEAIRQKHAGVGMSDIDVRKNACGACGMSLPTRTIEGLKDGRIMTCDACHRILYFTEGAI